MCVCVKFEQHAKALGHAFLTKQLVSNVGQKNAFITKLQIGMTH